MTLGISPIADLPIASLPPAAAGAMSGTTAGVASQTGTLVGSGALTGTIAGVGAATATISGRSFIKTVYGANNQTITITLASLPPDGGARASTAINNTTNLYVDALVQIKTKTGTDAIPDACVLNVYAYGTSDGGTTYGDGVTGTDAAITLTVPTSLRMIGQVNIPANTTTYKSNPMSVAAAFGGSLPAFWGIVVEHVTWATGGGSTLDATAGSHSATYQGIQRNAS